MDSRQTYLHTILKRIDNGYLVVLVVCLVALWPFLGQPGLPHATDAELHIYRLAELGRLVRGGEFYPRWAPNFYFGYGYPIFNYYAPLAYYLGLPVELLPGFDAVAGVKFVFVLSLVAAGLGMYGFVRDNWGRPAAYVAAAAYVYAPYVQYVDPHARGDLAEALAFGVFPLALWSLDRLRRQRSAGRLVLAVLFIAAVILSHNLMAMVFFALLLAWAIWQILLAWRDSSARDTERPSGRWLSKAILTIAVLALGLGVAAFFWLPVALEQKAVNLTSLIGDGGHFDFRNHFLTLAELFGPTSWLDWGATAATFSLNVGIVQWLLAIGGGMALLSGHARQRTHGLFFALSAIALIFMMTSASTAVWEVVPLLPYMQFPWRLLGPTAALLAVLSGIGVDTLLRARPLTRRTQPFKSWLPAALVAIVILRALPLAMIPPWAGEPWDTSALGVMLIEKQGRWLGTTSTADFVPATVDAIPEPNDAMIRDFQQRRPLDRVNRPTLPEDATVESEVVTPLHTRYFVSAPRPFLLRLFQFDFPGWQARIDGEPVKTELGRPEGFLVIPVPAGTHQVDVEFIETPARKLSWLITGSALALTIMGAVVVERKGQRADEFSPVGQAQYLPLRYGKRVAAVAVFLFLLQLLLRPAGLLHHHSTDDTAIPAQQDVYANFDEQLALIGYDAPARVSPGESFEVTLYWKARRKMDINFQVFLHMLAPNGSVVRQSDKLNPGEFPTKRWPTDQYVRDVHTLTLPEDLAPGTYTLSTGMWVQSEGWRLPLLGGDGQQAGDHFVLRQITVGE